MPGGLALILGLLTCLAAILLTVDMLVAILTVRLPNGFFTNEGGYEFPLVLRNSPVPRPPSRPALVEPPPCLAAPAHSLRIGGSVPGTRVPFG
jgi:hypothetical protein